MLTGIHPILTGELLMQLDAMGHSDAVAVVDAHFPARRLGDRVIDLPGLNAPEVLAAIRTVIPLDDSPALDLMTNADGAVLPVQNDLIEAAQASEADVRYVDRFDYYALTEQAFLIVRTGETRTYGNAVLRKGLVGHDARGEAK